MAELSSTEVTLARRIQELISKLLVGEANERDRSELAELVEQRSRLMHPPRKERGVAPERRRQFA